VARGEEARVDDDAVRVVDAEIAVEVHRPVDFTPHLPTHVECDRGHLVQGTVPLPHDQAGLFFDLSRQTGEH